MASRPSDHRERLRALDPGVSFIVEAPAGSGKTALLTQRFLKLLARVDEPEQLIALTFTRKAAQEMRSRVLDSLRLATGAAPRDSFATALRELGRAALDQDRARGWRLSENPARVRIQTIDALAATVARQNPLRSGFGPGIAVTEDAGELYREAARATIADLEDRGRWSQSVATLLRHLDNDWFRFENLLADTLSRRDHWLRSIAAGRDRAHLETQLAAAVAGALRMLAASIDPEVVPDLLCVARFAAANLARSKPDPPLAGWVSATSLPGLEPTDLERWRALADLLLTRDGQPRKRLTKNEGFPAKEARTASMKALLEQVLQHLQDTPETIPLLHAARDLPPCRYTDPQWATIEALLDLLLVSVAHLRLSFDARACVDFIEVAHAALAALGPQEDPTDLNLALDHRISHLLVDEFQDTSVTQYELLERLIAGWTGNDGRSVFLVGDPMQSIYRFRQAEVNLFTGTVERGHIASIPLERIRLSSNFRTQASAVAWLNSHFPVVLSNARCGPQTFSPVAAERAAKPGTAVHIHALPDEPDVGEADCIRKIVEESRAREPTATIAILIRSRAHLGAIRGALAAAGIPVSASEIDRLGEQPVVNDLIALTRALLHLGDRAAWLGVLRGPWCGLDLRALTLLVERAPTTTVWQLIEDDKRCRLLPVDDQRRLARCREVLARAVNLSGRARLSDLVEFAWHELGGAECVHTLDELVHARRYFDLLVKLDTDAAHLSPEGLQLHVDRLYATPRAHGPNPVEIMTIHRAKGLEFDIVILPGLARTTRGERHELLLWHEQIRADGTTGLLVAPIAKTGTEGDPIYAYLRAREREAAAAESFRLLYVALTRARETLHLIGRVARRDDGLAAPPRQSFLGMLWPALGAELQGPLQVPTRESSETRGSSPLAAQTPLWRLPVERSPLTAVAPPVAPEVFTPEPPLGFDWAGSSAKHVGTVTHWMLHRIGEEGISRWSVDRVSAYGARINARLAALGVPREQLTDAQQRVTRALSTLLSSARGRWIMDEGHDDIRAEYRLTGFDETGFANVVIDRMFVDADGRRWIVDFKTGVHSGGSLDAFLTSEVERYRRQLETYASIVERMDERPIMLGLYFPLLNEWREWRYRRPAS